MIVTNIFALRFYDWMIRNKSISGAEFARMSDAQINELLKEYLEYVNRMNLKD